MMTNNEYVISLIFAVLLSQQFTFGRMKVKNDFFIYFENVLSNHGDKRVGESLYSLP